MGEEIFLGRNGGEELNSDAGGNAFGTGGGGRKYTRSLLQNCQASPSSTRNLEKGVGSCTMHIL